MSNKRVRRYSFREGEVFPSGDKMARYVMRLSIALGDLRIAGHYATRSRQSYPQRLFFVRLLISELREVVCLLDPPNKTIVPTVEEFLASLPRGNKPSRTDIRRAHTRAMRMINAPMKDRAPVVVDGKSRQLTLRDDLKRVRNGFVHYGYDEIGATMLEEAMTAVAPTRTGYVINERTMRAEYADVVSDAMVHPFDVKTVVAMHERMLKVIEPIALYVHLVEAAWIFRQAPEVVSVTTPGNRPRPFKPKLHD